MAAITVEFFGITRLRSGRARLALEAGTLGEAYAALGRELPELEASILAGGTLHAACRANLNGDRFVSDPATPLHDGDALLLLSADMGG